jgi:hypothetical protein
MASSEIFGDRVVVDTLFQPRYPSYVPEFYPQPRPTPEKPERSDEEIKALFRDMMVKTNPAHGF